MEGRAAREPGSAILERDTGAVELDQAAGHTATYLQGQRISFAYGLSVDRGELRPGVALLDDELEALFDGGFAVADNDACAVTTTQGRGGDVLGNHLRELECRVQPAFIYQPFSRSLESRGEAC